MANQQTSQTHRSASPVYEVRRIASADKELWNSSCDVLVVGWGCAGASAALEAREQGLEVAVLERFEGGGASRLSGGIVYAGGGTPYQKAAGFEDSIANMLAYLKKENQGVVSDATLHRFCQQSAGNLAWLEKHGARYEASYLKVKTSYPPKNKFFYYSGNEAVPAYRTAGFAPIPRGHRTHGANMSGEELMNALQAATRQSGAKVMTQTVVRRLVVDAAGAVVGVECYQLPAGHPKTLRHQKLSAAIPNWRNFVPKRAQAMRNEQAQIEETLISSGEAKPSLIRARKGVVLATGGFIYNLAMVEQYAPHFSPAFLLGAAGCDGSGIRLGQSAQGTTGQMHNFSGWRFITPPAVWPRGIVVNSQGARFCNEQVYGERLGHEMMEHQGGKAWLILDKRLQRQAWRECATGGWWYFQWLPAMLTMLLAKKAKTPQALAAKIGADPATLAAEIAAYNAAVAAPSGDELQPSDPQGKAPDMCQALEAAPYYALDISVTSPTLPMAAITLGGLQVDEDSGLVLNAQGQGITGLYAAGRAAVGIPSARYISGLSLADCVFSGRRAAQHAAQS
jgi:3-oxo-5alpha-steroid 4-dehydrogenase